MDGGGNGTRDPRAVASELVSQLWGADRIDEFLTRAARQAAGVVDGAVSCGITMQAPAWSRPLAATSDEFAARMETIQYDVDDGPCLTCLREGDIVEVPDIAADRRWPAFRRRGRQERAGASLSIPLRFPHVDHDDAGEGRGALGALNLYTRTVGGLDDADRARGIAYAGHVAGAVGLAVHLAAGEEHRRHLYAALVSRSLVDQAIGVVVGRSGVSVDTAFAVLRTRSQHTNTKLREVATQVLAEATTERQ